MFIFNFEVYIFILLIFIQNLIIIKFEVLLTQALINILFILLRIKIKVSIFTIFHTLLVYLVIK